MLITGRASLDGMRVGGEAIERCEVEVSLENGSRDPVGEGGPRELKVDTICPRLRLFFRKLLPDPDLNSDQILSTRMLP